MVLCLLTTEIKKENVKNKVLFVENVKKPTMGCMMFTNDGDTFFVHKEHMDHVTSQTMLPVCLMSLTSLSQFKEALGTYQ